MRVPLVLPHAPIVKPVFFCCCCGLGVHASHVLFSLRREPPSGRTSAHMLVGDRSPQQEEEMSVAGG